MAKGMMSKYLKKESGVKSLRNGLSEELLPNSQQPGLLFCNSPGGKHSTDDRRPRR